jgi:hypothetical protein
MNHLRLHLCDTCVSVFVHLSPCSVQTLPSCHNLERPFLSCYSSICLNNFLEKDLPISTKAPPQGSPSYPQGSTWLLGESSSFPLVVVTDSSTCDSEEVSPNPFPDPGDQILLKNSKCLKSLQIKRECRPHRYEPNATHLGSNGHRE